MQPGTEVHYQRKIVRNHSIASQGTKSIHMCRHRNKATEYEDENNEKVIATLDFRHELAQNARKVESHTVLIIHISKQEQFRSAPQTTNELTR